MALTRLALAAVVLTLPTAGLAIPLWQESSTAPRAERADTLPDFTRIANRATSAVVSIATVQEAEGGEDPIRSLLDPSSAEPQKGIGSGFFIHPDGYLVTNAHVVEGATDLEVTVQRENGHTRDYRARVVGLDAPTDSALLKLDAPGETFPTLPLGDSDGLQVAEWIAAIGNPYGLSYSITVGVVSYKGRTDVTPAGRDGYYDYIQTDASINPGNSGGPILNTRGEVVAIANAVNAVGQGIGFAIPINMVKQVLGPLLKDGKVQRSWIGISVEDLSSAAVREARLPVTTSGVLVADVTANSPGAAAGLKAGDVVTRFAGSEVSSAQRLRWLAANAGIGRQVPMTVLRDGKPVQLTAKLAEMPEDEPEAPIPQPVDVGLLVREVDIPTARRAGLALPFGACVREVTPNSPAAQAGLRSGDVILKVGSSNIHDPGSLSRVLAKVDSGSVANLVLKRQSETRFVAMRKP